MGLAGEERVHMRLNMCNRHGLIAGASGTGKTITMKVMAESFSDAGVPVFLCDVKGDVSGLGMAGQESASMEKRIDKFGIRDGFRYRAYPVCFWDIYQEKGHAVRATVSDMGPDLLSMIMGLTPAQEGVLNILFRIADDRGLLLIDIKDLRSVINFVSAHRAEYSASYGNISSQSLGGILRALLPLENQGGELFFGEPDLNIFDWMRKSDDGRGVVNILHSVKLARSPVLYASFLLWMMAEMFERLPEVGDLEEPKLVFFFDEAHMLFSNTPRALAQKIEQMVKLIRSKGVGIYFVTQNPGDIPDGVLAQLSNRVQHALRAYTPAEQRAVKAAAKAFRANPDFDTEQVLMELGVGQALTSFLDEEGIPQQVMRTDIVCPQSLMGPVDEAVRRSIMAADPMAKYDEYVDSESAYEVLQKRAKEEEEQSRLEAERAQLEKEKAEFEKQKAKEQEAALKRMEREQEAALKRREKELEAEQRKKERAAERRKSQIERTLISTGAQVLKRGLLKTLFK